MDINLDIKLEEAVAAQYLIFLSGKNLDDLFSLRINNQLFEPFYELIEESYNTLQPEPGSFQEEMLSVYFSLAFDKIDKQVDRATYDKALDYFSSQLKKDISSYIENSISWLRSKKIMDIALSPTVFPVNQGMSKEEYNSLCDSAAKEYFNAMADTLEKLGPAGDIPEKRYERSCVMENIAEAFNSFINQNPQSTNYLASVLEGKARRLILHSSNNPYKISS